MPQYRFKQIKHYFYILLPAAKPIDWYIKLLLLFEYLYTSFKAFCILSQNVSIDKIIKAFTGRSVYTVKMKNKPVKKGYKI